MSLDEFVAKWNGKGIDFDKFYGDQCMDLMHQYCVEVLGLSDGRILAAPTALEIWTKNPFGKDKFETIANTPTGIPEKGDIMIWKEPYGRYTDEKGVVRYAGHVAIFYDGDEYSFRSFDQNFPTGSKSSLQSHTYTGVVGWLRYKKTDNTQTMQITVKERDWLISRATVAKEVSEYLEINNPDNAPTSEYKNVIGGYKSRITDLTNQLTNASAEVKNREEQVSRLKDQVIASDGLRLDLQTKLNDALKKSNEVVGVYEGQLKSKQEAIDVLAKQKGDLNKKIASLEAEIQSLKTKTISVLTISDLFIALASKFAGK